jgi:hypothetical protein
MGIVEPSAGVPHTPSLTGARPDRATWRAGPGWSPRAAALMAGIGLLTMAITALVADQLLVQAAATGSPAAASAALRGAALLFLATAGLDLLVALALFSLLLPVHRDLSAAAAVLRVVYTTMLLLATSHLLGPLAGPAPVAVDAAVETFRTTWDLGLAVFGAHLAVVGVLVWRSRFMPRWLGGLLVLSGAGYLVDGVGVIAAADYGLRLSLATFVGEVALLGWLLVRARRLPAAADGPAHDGDR